MRVTCSSKYDGTLTCYFERAVLMMTINIDDNIARMLAMYRYSLIDKAFRYIESVLIVVARRIVSAIGTRPSLRGNRCRDRY